MRDNDRGVVANTASWPNYQRTNADELMAQHFPEGYVVELEEETIVGQAVTFNEHLEEETIVGNTTDSDEHRHGAEINTGVELSTASLHGSTTSRDETEYRIFYRRR
jgi:hypothetical protein